VREPAVSVQYELKVDHERMELQELENILLELSNLDPFATEGPAAVFARIALYYGYRISGIQTVHQPTSFQEMTLVTETPTIVRSLPVEYQLSSGTILSGFIFLTGGVSILACFLHALQRKWRNMKASGRRGKE